MSNDSQFKASETAVTPFAAPAAAVKVPEAVKPVIADVKVEAQPVAAAPKPVVTPAPVKATPAKAPVKKAAPRKVAKKPAAVAKPVVAKKAAAKKAAPVSKAPVSKAKATKTAQPAVTVLSLPKIKEKIMSNAPTQKDLSKLLDNAVNTVKTQAKAAYAKGSAVAGEVGGLSKGNIEAVVESSKILATGLKDIGSDYVTETKSAYETATGDFKKLATIKSPTELFQLQGELLRRNFDAAVAFGSKETEKFVKLSNDAFAPISNRVSLIVDKVSKAA